MDREIQTRFGELLRKYRKEMGYSQEEFAQLSGLHYTYISSVERGERNLSLLNIYKMCQVLRKSSFAISLVQVLHEKVEKE